MNDNIQSKARQSINRHTRIALEGVASLSSASGLGLDDRAVRAVVAPGTVVVDSHVKKVSTRPAASSARSSPATATACGQVTW